ncbi:MFS transporter [Kitasatospora sp. NBC_01539]|uniref:MFS transporter n=1 Tax=Kitasatospora sp. NBC_01539 TaxID=2903577 RepID=UPI0038601A7D
MPPPSHPPVPRQPVPRQPVRSRPVRRRPVRSRRTRLLDGVLLAAERPRPRRIAAWRHAHWLTVATVCLGAFLGQLTASITVLVFPALQDDFHAGFAAVEWVSLAYLLVLVALLAPVGRLSDSVGRKTVYLGGFAVFGLASLGAGFATGLWMLVVCRAVQAVGGAMMQANSVALVARGVPAPAMRTALGVQAAAQALGLALGPTVGGLLVTQASWRWAFWVNVPIAVVGLAAGLLLLPRSHPDAAQGGRTRPRTPEPLPALQPLPAPEPAPTPEFRSRPASRTASGESRFDLAGLVLLAGASSALLLALSTASGLPLPGWAVVALLAVSAVLCRALVRQEQRADRPVVPPGLVNTPHIRAGLLVALAGYLLLFCPLVLGPVMLAAAGVPAATAGLVITALPAAFAVAATLGGALLPREWPDGRRGGVGALVAAAGLAGLAVLPVSAVLSPVPLAVAGFGLGLLLPANNALVMRAVPAESAAVAGGMVNMVRSLGTALGTALPVLGVHVAGAGTGGRAVLLLLTGVAVAAVRLCAVPGRG